MGAGSVCTLCPSQCNVAFTVRDERGRAGARARQPRRRRRVAVRQGALGLPGGRAPERITQPLVRDGGHCARRRGSARWTRPSTGLARRARRPRRSPATAPPTRRATCSSASSARRSARRSVDSRGRRGARPGDGARMLAHPTCRRGRGHRPRLRRAGARVRPDARGADPRPAAAKGVRRHGAALVVAGSRPTALDGGAAERLRCAPGAAEALLRALQKALVELGRREAGRSGRRRRGAPRPQTVNGRRRCRGAAGRAGGVPGRSLAGPAGGAGGGRHRRTCATPPRLLTEAENVVVVWGERLGSGRARRRGAARAARPRAAARAWTRREGSGLIEVPTAANGRGLREIGCLARPRPRPRRRAAGMTAAQARDAALRRRGEGLLPAALRPDARAPRPASCGTRRCGRPSSSRTSSSSASRSSATPTSCSRPSPTPRRRARSRIPTAACSACGPAIGHPGEVRAEWRVLVELAAGSGSTMRARRERGRRLRRDRRGGARSTRDDAGRDRRPKGVRWPDARRVGRGCAAALRRARLRAPAEPPAPLAAGDGVAAARDPPGALGVVGDRALAVAALPRGAAGARAEPARRRALGRRVGRRVQVRATATPSTATRADPPQRAKRGTATLIEGTAEGNANVLVDGRAGGWSAEPLDARRLTLSSARRHARSSSPPASGSSSRS